MAEVILTLHKEAGIDYNRPILRNMNPATLYEEALKYEEGTAITSSGALATSSGAKTGRSPRDKRIVDEESTRNDVWWGGDTQEIISLWFLLMLGLKVPSMSRLMIKYS